MRHEIWPSEDYANRIQARLKKNLMHTPRTLSGGGTVPEKVKSVWKGGQSVNSRHEIQGYNDCDGSGQCRGHFHDGRPYQRWEGDQSEMLTNIQYRILRRISPGAP